MARYWLDLFTGNTWDKFLQEGAHISGFRESKKTTTKKIRPGDYLLCYITGISRFIGVLEVISEYYYDDTLIWENDVFPCRLKVKLIHNLKPENSIPVKSMKDKLSVFQNLKNPKNWSGAFRGSPREWSKNDGETIINEIKNAELNPKYYEVDIQKWNRKAKTYDTPSGSVTIPESEEEYQEQESNNDKVTHQEIQWLLLKLGSNLNLEVWVASNDKNRSYNGYNFQDIPRLRKSLPMQFDNATNKTIEKIDVLWLEGDTIISAFEVEHTTSIYSGLLRMADLVSMQPNINIDLFIVAPDERRDKVFEEINRPTFAKLKRPLPKLCKYIPYSELKNKIESVGDMIQYMKPEFIHEIAEECLDD